jgi:hypothetical protein
MVDDAGEMLSIGGFRFGFKGFMVLGFELRFHVLVGLK